MEIWKNNFNKWKSIQNSSFINRIKSCLVSFFCCIGLDELSSFPNLIIGKHFNEKVYRWTLVRASKETVQNLWFHFEVYHPSAPMDIHHFSIIFLLPDTVTRQNTLS